MKILDGRRQLGVDFTTYLVGLAAEAAKVEVEIPAEASNHILVAEVNHNRWIVVCPDCLGATFVWLDDPRQFCPSCFNGAAGHKVRPVLLPPELERGVAALERRPLPQNRNWRAPEVAADLEAENREHGLDGRAQRSAAPLPALRDEVA